MTTAIETPATVRRDELGVRLKFEQASAGLWWGPCFECGAPKASVGTEGYSCIACVLAATLEEMAPWPEEPNMSGMEPEALPLDVLPPVLHAQVESVAHALQVPADLPFLLGLGTVSAALAGKVEVEVKRGWTEPVGIYVACILPPASRKSPAYAAMTSPLREWEAESVRRAMPRVLAAQDIVDVAEKRLERAKTDAARGSASPDDVERARLQLEEDRANVPSDGRLLAGDITAEAMTLRMAAQGGRLAILEPEAGPLQLLAGRYNNSGGARLDEIKKAWSAEAIMVDRVNRPPVRVDHPALTLVLCLQPGVLEGLENHKAFRYEGVLGRILWCQPRHGLGTRRTGAQVPDIDTVAAAAYSRVVRILAELAPSVCEDGTERAHVLRLSDQALDVLHAYEAELELELADGARYVAIRDWAGKAHGQAVRLAALLELARRAEDGRELLGPAELSSWAMESAVRIIRALTSHALKVLAPPGRDAAFLSYVLRRTVELPRRSTLRDLYERTKGQKAIGDMEDLRALVGGLVERGCLRLRPQPSTGGRPGSPVIEIHPSLSRLASRSRPTGPENIRKFAEVPPREVLGPDFCD